MTPYIIGGKGFDFPTVVFVKRYFANDVGSAGVKSEWDKEALSVMI